MRLLPLITTDTRAAGIRAVPVEPRPRVPGRNEPCHCGSGQKYKRCCKAKEQAKPQDLVRI